MGMIAHLTISVRKRLALARDEAERRAHVRRLARVAGRSLLLFNVVDDHIHLVVRAEQPGLVGRSIRLSLKAARPDLDFKPTHPEVVDSRAYLHTLVRYVFRQASEKGLGRDALWTGSSFQDLVGARRLPGLAPRAIFQELPRLRFDEVARLVGLRHPPRRAKAPRSVPDAVSAAASACAAAPSLEGRSAPERRARIAVVAACAGAGIGRAEVRRCLARSRWTINRMAAEGADPADLSALLTRMGLEREA